MLQICLTFYAVLNFQVVFALAPTDVLFLISGQDSSSYHRQLSESLRKNIQEQATELAHSNDAYTIRVRLLNELFSQPGDWTLLRALSHLNDAQFTPPLINERTKWIILCEESTHIDVRLLLAQLAKFNHNEATYYGFPLHDQDATIIHHFAFFENPKWFPYPMLRAGVVLTVPILSSLAATVAGQGIAAGAKLPTRTTDFSIDAAHELARFMLNHLRIERGAPGLLADNAKGQPTKNLSEKIAASTRLPPPPPQSLETTSEVFRIKNVRKIILQKASFICPTAPTHLAGNNEAATATINVKAAHTHSAKNRKANAACAMYAKPMDTSSCLPVKRQQIFFAIKTCHKFHRERLPIIEATWAPYAAHRRYYSDVTDASIPTIGTGIPNADTGHCSKTLAILKLALKDIAQMNRESKSIPSDDGNGVGIDVDVDVGVSDVSLIRWLLLADDDTLLSVSHLCDLLGCFNHTEMVYLGERYGYRLHAEDGFNYITGGGGILLSLPIVDLILKHCTCPTIASPDDMILGACLHMLGIKPIHSSRFHQARPNDYARELLQLEPPISFHKFWQLDPIQVYNRWFATADRAMLSLELLKNKSNHQNTKLGMRLKEFANRKNKSQYATKAQSCKTHTESKELKNYATKMDAKNQLAMGIEAALVPETASHLDL